MYGLTTELVSKIKKIAEDFHIRRLVLFGSRARGDYRASSDIDLAVYGLPERDEWAMREALEALPTLLKIDLVPIRQGLDAELLKQISKDGIVLMESAFNKHEQFKQALERTKEAIQEFNQTASAVVRDGAIQRFEFSTELAWKACRDKLLSDGYVGIDSPKAVMRQAFEAGMIADEQGWLELLQARNLTSHVYSEQQAKTIYQGIVEKYVPLMEKLSEKLS